MAEYLYVLRPVRPEMPESPTEDEMRIVSQHYERLQRETAAGTVIFAGRTLTDPMGLVAFVAGSDEEAERFMQNDPAVAQGVMTATVYPFRVALMRGA